MAGSDRAVDVQMARLRRKIEDDPRQPRYILTMRGSGYVLRLGELSPMLGPLRRWLGRLIVPRSLFWRSLLIVVVPLLILQILLTYIFYNRHWDTVTRWLAFGVASEVALLAETIEEAPDAAARDAFIERAQPQHRPQHHPRCPAAGSTRPWRPPASGPMSATSTTRSWKPSPSACPTRSPSTWRPTIRTASPSSSRSSPACCR